MKSKVITVSIREDAEKKLRQIAAVRYGKMKGYLGKALTEAVEVWAKKKEEVDVNARALAMLRKGFKMGKIKWKSRDELHER